MRAPKHIQRAPDEPPSGLSEDVVMAGRGVVLSDHRKCVKVERAEVVDATADAFARAAAEAPGAAVGVISGDRAAPEREGRSVVVVRAAAEAVAADGADAPLPADGQIVGERTIHHGRVGIEQVGDGAAPAVAAAGAGRALAAQSLIVFQGTVADIDDTRCEDVAGVQLEVAQGVEDAAAGTEAGRHRSSTADVVFAADGPVVRDSTGTDVAEGAQIVGDAAAETGSREGHAAACGVAAAAERYVVRERGMDHCHVAEPTS